MSTESERHKILVVDDDPQLLDLLVDTLRAIGHDVSGAPGGVEALKQLKNEQFDLMITDIKMPDVDGLQLLKKVRRHYSQMPVLFITAVESKDIIGQAAPDGFLAKPFRISQIEELIQGTLKKRESSFSSRMPRVLMVGPNGHLPTQVNDLLTNSQCIPFHAPHGEAAMEELENGSIDLVVSDTKLPDMDGIALGRKIKERFPATRVVLTRPPESGGRHDDGVVAAAVDACLSSPFDATEFLNMLQADRWLRDES